MSNKNRNLEGSFSDNNVFPNPKSSRHQDVNIDNGQHISYCENQYVCGTGSTYNFAIATDRKDVPKPKSG